MSERPLHEGKLDRAQNALEHPLQGDLRSDFRQSRNACNRR